MPNHVIGIAGGSGVGKSTLAFGIADQYPDKALIFHLDDYFKPEKDVPVLHAIKNWDSPDALYIGKMLSDLALLKSGKTAVVNTKSPRLNPDFIKTGKRIPVEFQPMPLIVVEGFLTLYIEQLREILDLSIYLDAPFELHTSRRVHGKLHNFPAEYDEVILRPMYERYIKPSKKYADTIIDVQTLNQEQLLDVVDRLLKEYQLIA